MFTRGETMYNLMEELRKAMNRLDAVGDREGSQAVSQAIIRIENLAYDVKRYKEALTGRRG